MQMKPTFSLTKRDEESSTFKKTPEILKDGGCPIGTVPIRRTTKEDLIRERRADRFNASYAGGTFHVICLDPYINFLDYPSHMITECVQTLLYFYRGISR